ncbi:MAG TPA: helix-turn-helix transcriptional regulator [Polyangiaceae bacterium]|jgi:transcriptional regulator with XRE-family HTH domain|nr:helix-turn-helix transcriptional regulator [Polyangiaceae bacterium]
MMTAEEVVSSFAREVRRRREAAGMTLDTLAQRSGLTPNYIGNIENGQRDPSLTTLFKLAEGLGVQAGELIGGVGGLSAAANEFGQLLEKAPNEVRDSVANLLRFFSRKLRR